ncbi:MAG: transporter substrate-binding domain-containing protein [Kurthia sp.]|nr:transporter substrate-binding domain-containing protein [Candidatus Kurthia equi]
MKKLLSAVTLSALFLGACGNEEVKDKAAEASKLQEIQDDKKIQIGLEGTFPPFSFHDEAGDLTGFEYEIADQIADDLGVEAEYVETKWDSLIAGLDTDKYDFVINNVSITDERKEKYDFSTPYMKSEAVVAVRDDNKAIKQPADIKGRKSAQTITSNFARDAEALGAEVVATNDLMSSIELVEQGRADATIHDRVTFLTYLKEKPDTKLNVLDGSINSTDIALILNKDNDEFKEKLNEIIKQRTEDGTFEKISKKYFGENIISND